ncbi:MAG TPA: hypothetical protein VNL14_11300 [Candidatus Acidoferrales bacterium]|nr:hypothetical protein [Candidatus Acidoferrales bacterium]
MELGKKFPVGALLIGLALGPERILSAATVTAQSASAGGVTAKVAYLNPQSRDEPRFQVVLDTHSVDLDGYDLKTLTLLRDDKGKDYFPSRAENKGGGHHREITLIFPKVAPEARRLELVIKDIAGVKERIFGWNLE